MVKKDKKKSLPKDNHFNFVDLITPKNLALLGGIFATAYKLGIFHKLMGINSNGNQTTENNLIHGTPVPSNNGSNDILSSLSSIFSGSPSTPSIPSTQPTTLFSSYNTDVPDGGGDSEQNNVNNQSFIDGDNNSTR